MDRKISSEQQNEAWKRFLKGQSIRQIAEDLGFSKSGIHRHISRLREETNEADAKEFATQRGIALAKIGLAESEAWVGWEASKLEGPGDSRFLREIARCIELRARILGLFAPAKFAATTMDGKNAPIQVNVNPKSNTEYLAEFFTSLAASGHPLPGDDGLEM
ncbi:MAG: hypothetical protein HY774_26905 [Acidobacteria bacterium]|nr:hypothetical protein [Acidobacteriota bacterium]